MFEKVYADIEKRDKRDLERTVDPLRIVEEPGCWIPQI